MIDIQKFDELFLRHLEGLEKHCEILVRNDGNIERASSLVQTTYRRVRKNLPREDVANWLAYLCRVTDNALIDRTRKRGGRAIGEDGKIKPRRMVAIENLGEIAEPHIESAETVENHDLLEAVLDRLKEPLRQEIFLLWLYRVPQTAIAQIKEITKHRVQEEIRSILAVLDQFSDRLL